MSNKEIDFDTLPSSGEIELSELEQMYSDKIDELDIAINRVNLISDKLEKVFDRLGDISIGLNIK